MSSRDVRSYRRMFETTELDLNRAPSAADNGEQHHQQQQEEGPSTQQQVAMIDLDAIDDDVVESSPTAFVQAKTKSRRNRGRTIVDVDLEDHTRATTNNGNRCRRDPSNQTIINGDLYINLEGNNSSMKGKARKSPEPPKDPVFNCPICMGPLIEATSTRCGHIFCKNCIRAAITAQGKCPTCRKKITLKELIRVFLPSTS